MESPLGSVSVAGVRPGLQSRWGLSVEGLGGFDSRTFPWLVMIAVRLLVSGIVQGVGFRDFTARAAVSLGVLGWVRNLYDERVEVWCEGEADAVEALILEVSRGPRYAEVSGVERTEVRPRGHSAFTRAPTAAQPEELTSSC